MNIHFENLKITETMIGVKFKFVCVLPPFEDWNFQEGRRKRASEEKMNEEIDIINDDSDKSFILQTVNEIYCLHGNKRSKEEIIYKVSTEWGKYLIETQNIMKSVMQKKSLFRCKIYKIISMLSCPHFCPHFSR